MMYLTISFTGLSFHISVNISDPISLGVKILYFILVIKWWKEWFRDGTHPVRDQVLTVVIALSAYGNLKHHCNSPWCKKGQMPFKKRQLSLSGLTDHFQTGPMMVSY